MTRGAETPRRSHVLVDPFPLNKAFEMIDAYRAEANMAGVTPSRRDEPWRGGCEVGLG